MPPVSKTRPFFYDNISLKLRVLLVLEKEHPRRLHLDEIASKLPDFDRNVLRVALSRAKAVDSVDKDSAGRWGLVMVSGRDAVRVQDKTWLEWLDRNAVCPCVEDGADALDAWRRQIPRQDGEAKSFENWLLVEMVRRLRGLDAGPIRTNGTLPGLERDYDMGTVVASLKGRKAASGSISPDIAVGLGPLADDLVVNIEIKTQGMDNKVYLDDVRLVKHHNESEPKPNYRACFLWIGLASVAEEEHFEKKARKVSRRVSELTGLSIKPTFLRPWLAYFVTTCVA